MLSSNDRKVIFIDISNFYSQLINFIKEENPAILRDYFLTWLDFDALALKIANSSPDIWVFYSEKRIGPSNVRIEGKKLHSYIKRINMLEGVTAYDVNIPGEQREYFTINCPHCKKESQGESTSEKGIDASLTVHMFDTMDSWDIAFLFSGDADFVPAVKSLRRRGKVVIGGGFPSIASSAILRECYSYIDLFDAFIRFDIAMYLLFKIDGIIYRWLIEDRMICSDVNQFVGFSLYPSDNHYYISFTWHGTDNSLFLNSQLDKIAKIYNYRLVTENYTEQQGTKTLIVRDFLYLSIKRRIQLCCQQIETIENIQAIKKYYNFLDIAYRRNFFEFLPQA